MRPPPWAPRRPRCSPPSRRSAAITGKTPRRTTPLPSRSRTQPLFPSRSRPSLPPRSRSRLSRSRLSRSRLSRSRLSRSRLSRSRLSPARLSQSRRLRTPHGWRPSRSWPRRRPGTRWTLPTSGRGRSRRRAPPSPTHTPTT
ncbi:pentapeptide repeat-containing protein [Actinoplanes sp. NPDC026619]|uniref:pentapeptide repeat-containing protein n=1 Tax=Actinoplanes sp. NPDC026619 TaxID=3155798 RepID=UPI0033FFA014